MLNYKENRPFLDKVSNFPIELYHLEDDNTKIHQIMYALLEIGVGTAKTLQEVGATLQRSLANTKFYDLDDMYGSIFRIYRLTDETYTYNPYADALTKSQWLEIDAKDATYRHRIALLLGAFQYGGSPEGIAMVAEAASGIKCDVFEAWRENVSGIGITNSTREFIIVPRAAKGLVRSVTFQGGGDTVTFAGHGITNGTIVRFTSILTTTGIVVNTPYYVVNSQTNTFQLASTSGGSVINLVGNGSGTMIVMVSKSSDERIINEEQEASIIDLVNLFKPVNTLCTVIENTQISEEAVKAYYASAISQSTITRTIIEGNIRVPHYIYLNYEDEFCVNDDITLISIVEEQDDYIYQLGTLLGNVSEIATTMNVVELNPASSPVFYCKIANEIVLVTDRVKYGNNANEYTYTITRAQNNTEAATHAISNEVIINVISIVPENPTARVIWKPWVAVGLADSPDNYPKGKYPSRADRYDKQGRYLFEFSSQEDYMRYLYRQIRRLDGEIRTSSNTVISAETGKPILVFSHYRVPLYTLDPNPLIANNNDLLAHCSPEIATRILL